MTEVVVAVIVTAVFFDFTNGFHDTANAMATSIATGALRPRTAVVLAGVLNLAGAFLSVQVAKTISGGLVEESRITPVVILGGLAGAILWNLLSWLVSMPSSLSHALFGGLIGATWTYAGADAVKFRQPGGQGFSEPRPDGEPLEAAKRPNGVAPATATGTSAGNGAHARQPFE